MHYDCGAHQYARLECHWTEKLSHQSDMKTTAFCRAQFVLVTVWDHLTGLLISPYLRYGDIIIIINDLFREAKASKWIRANSVP